MNIQTFAVQYSDLVEHAWNDENFLAALQAHPHEALRESGIDVPSSAHVNVIMTPFDPTASLGREISLWEKGNSTGVYDLIIPIKPSPDAALFPESAADDACCSCPCSCT